MFSYITSCGYEVIYKRATNREEEFAIDQNEMSSIYQGFDDIKANVEGVGVISDRDLPKYMEGVTLWCTFNRVGGGVNSKRIGKKKTPGIELS